VALSLSASQLRPGTLFKLSILFHFEQIMFGGGTDNRVCQCHWAKTCSTVAPNGVFFFPNHLGMLYRQGLILERKGDIAGAIAASKKSLAEAKKAGPELQAEYVKLNTALLERLKK
jgi:hypothetical protein